MNTPTNLQAASPLQNVVDAMRVVSLALRPVHGVLLDATRLEYEKEHGAVKNAAALLQLALSHPDFAWLRPLSQLMARADELVDAEELEGNEVLALLAAIDSWALVDAPSEGFQARYVGFLQKRADLVMAHGQLRSAVRQLARVAAPLGRPLFVPSGGPEVGLA